MQKSECESAIRRLATDWASAEGIALDSPSPPSFSDFISWVRAKGFGHYLEFRSVRGPLSDAEDWFDQELRQTWRN